ncbi:MAG: signal peptide peptidase SppA [Phycisphaerales bacterium]|nr:MAG: signal peptide peptidase SppA [Phycisphaerales bacterium]
MRGFGRSSRIVRAQICCTLSGLVLASAGCGPRGLKITPVPVDRTLKERVLMRGEGFSPPKIALIDVEGVLMNADTGGLLEEGEHPVSLLLEKLHKAEADERVKGVVLRINSPGGSVTASDLMYQEIQGLKARTGKPIVAVFMDVAASGGYYVACACDEIIAHRTSVTGSIGVVMQMFTVYGTMEKIGMTADAIKSGPNKDAGSPFRSMEAAERELFQEMVNEFYEQFLRIVTKGRPQLTPERIRELADGRVFTAEQALEAGLVDRIGTLRDALAVCAERTGLESPQVVVYHRPLAWKPNIYAQSPYPGAQRDHKLVLALPSWMTSPAPRFMYLWAPGH